MIWWLQLLVILACCAVGWVAAELSPQVRRSRRQLREANDRFEAMVADSERMRRGELSPVDYIARWGDAEQQEWARRVGSGSRETGPTRDGGG